MSGVFGAIGYGRVSTKEQADGNHSLENQRRDIPAFCQQRQFECLSYFDDPGASGDNLDRAGLQQALAFIRKNKGKVHYLVVTELSRLSREAKDQAHVMCEVRKFGVEVMSIREPNVDGTPAGKLFANMIGSFNQYFLDSLKVRTKESMQAAFKAGLYPRASNIGYVERNGPIPPGQSNKVIDRERAPLIRRAFEEIRSGKTQAEALRIVTDLGLRSHKGEPLAPQTFNAMLRRKFYCGWMHSAKWNLTVKGLHEPIISEELFEDVQRILDGKRPNVAKTRKDKNPDFPLTVFVRCGVCGKPMTGGWTTNGHSRGKKFGSYWCRNNNCTRVRKHVLEEKFFKKLERLTPDPDALRDFSKFLAKRWKQTQIDSETVTKKLAKAT